MANIAIVFSLSLLGMLILVVLEQYVLRKKNPDTKPWFRIFVDINTGHAFLWVSRAFEVAAYAWIYQQISTEWVNAWPLWLVYGFAFIAWDFCFYWTHRMHHAIPFFWSMHEVHHSGDRFDLSLAMRNAWFSPFITVPFFIPMAWLGVPPLVFVVVGSIHYTYQWANHSGTMYSLGFLEQYLVTPTNHRVHHGVEQQYHNRNFGGFFLCWDRWFGTYYAPPKNTLMEVGIPDPIPSDNPFWLNMIPLCRFLRLPVPSLPTQKRYYHDAWLFAGGVGLFFLLLDYVQQEGVWYTLPWHQHVIHISTIAVLTIFLGALSDGRRWAQWAWIVGMGWLWLHYVDVPTPSHYTVWVLVALTLHAVWPFRRA